MLLLAYDNFKRRVVKTWRGPLRRFIVLSVPVVSGFVAPDVDPVTRARAAGNYSLVLFRRHLGNYPFVA